MKGECELSIFLICFLQILLYTLGVIVICGLVMEVCYQICFYLMGGRATRIFWIVTGWLGTPIHELGHAITCLLFCHRIETIRLWPSRKGGAAVEHSYNRRNPLAVFGNVWIALGPIFAGLAVIVLGLALVYPSTMDELRQALSSPLPALSLAEEAVWHVGVLIKGICLEQTQALGWRIVALCAMLSVSLHVRLSVADLKGMLRGLPMYACLTAIVAAVIAMMGSEAHGATVDILRRVAWVIVLLFSLILMFALALLLLLLILRLMCALVAFFFRK